MKAPSRRSDLWASFSASPWTPLRSSLVSRAQTSTLAFTSDAGGAAGAEAAGLVAVAGLDPVGALAFGGALLSPDLQPLVTRNNPKKKIPKMTAAALDDINLPPGSHLEFCVVS